jgi:hypothetical protein
MTKGLLASVADELVSAVVPAPRRALTPDQVDAELRAVRRHAQDRHERLKAVRSYRNRWAHASAEEVAEEVALRIRRRHRANHSAASNGRRP